MMEVLAELAYGDVPLIRVYQTLSHCAHMHFMLAQKEDRDRWSLVVLFFL